jgi:hypothetical protein
MPPASQPARYDVDPDVATARARLAGLIRQNADPGSIAEARRLLGEAVESKFIDDLLAGKYLTDAGLARLAVLLNPPEPG